MNGKNFKLKMRAEHIELLQSPWLIELGALYLNFNGIDNGESIEISSHFSCKFNPSEPLMEFTLMNSIKLKYDLTCAICLVRSCFCKFQVQEKIAIFICSFVSDLTGYGF